MGFECEVLLPESSSDGDISDRINEMSWYYVERYVGRRERDRINYAYMEYINNKLEEQWDKDSDQIVKDYCENNDLLDPDDQASHSEVLKDKDNIQAAREEWGEKELISLMNQYDMDEFISNEYDSMVDFVNHFNIPVDIDPHQEAAKSLGNAVGARVKIGRGGSTVWHVLDDSSLRGDGTGMEIVSPVFGMMDGLQALQRVLNWIEDNASTNETTGLHVSFSIEGKDEDDYDYLKMIVLYDENYTADLFNRFSNDYAKQMRTVLFTKLNKATDVERMPERDLMAAVEKLRKLSPYVHDISSKYFSFRHRANGVFEFRTMGNANYETRYEDIRKRIIAMASIMKVGSDPNLRAREYLSRVYRMLTSEKFSDPALNSGSDKPSQSIPFMLSSFTPIFARNKELAILAVKSPEGFLFDLVYHLRLYKINLSDRQIRQLRLYSKKHGVTPEMEYLFA